MFGVGSTVQERLARAKEDRNLLDELTEEIAVLSKIEAPRDPWRYAVIDFQFFTRRSAVRHASA
jgi:hypothetical protein